MPTPPHLVFDTTVLSNFALIAQVPLLKQLYRTEACTTLMVAEEVQRGLTAGYASMRAIAEILVPFEPSGWLTVVDLEAGAEQALYLEFAPTLGAGEASCLAIAIARNLVMASDDLAARRKATERHVRLTGTIGILVRLVREGHLPLPKANQALAQMIAQRYRSPVDRLDELI